MRVISQLADLDLEVGRMARDGDRIVVEASQSGGLETRIEIGPLDVARVLGLALRNPRIIFYVLALPVLCRRARKQGPAKPADPWADL
jgi:hypothetical protein